MITNIFSLAPYSYFRGGALGNMLSQWEQAGFFSYLLPFLLIFALIFGILTKLNFFKGKGVNVVIAFVVGLMSLQFEFVSIFFAELFPRMGIALSIILVILILGGLFIDPKNKGFMVGLMVVIVFIIGIVVFNTFGAFGWASGYWWQNNWQTLLGVGVFIALVIAIIVGSKPTNNNPEVDNPLAKLLKAVE